MTRTIPLQDPAFPTAGSPGPVHAAQDGVSFMVVLFPIILAIVGIIMLVLVFLFFRRI
jgi:hypothetical protein